MNKFFMLVSMAALVACNGKDDSGSEEAGGTGADWCADYIAALDGCYGEAGFSLEDYGVDGDALCEPYASSTDDATRDLFYCYVDAIEAADCSTEDGITEMSTAAASCS